MTFEDYVSSKLNELQRCLVAEHLRRTQPAEQRSHKQPQESNGAEGHSSQSSSNVFISGSSVDEEPAASTTTPATTSAVPPARPRPAPQAALTWRIGSSSDEDDANSNAGHDKARPPIPGGDATLQTVAQPKVCLSRIDTDATPQQPRARVSVLEPRGEDAPLSIVPKSPQIQSSSGARGSVLFSGTRSPLVQVGTPRGSVTEVQHFDVLEFWLQTGARRPSAFLRRGATGMGATKDLEDMSEEGADSKRSRYMISPSAFPRIMWDLMGLFMVGFDCITIPLMVFSPPETTFTIFMMWTTRLFWTFNVLITFRTGHLREDGTIEMNGKKTARRYAATWLPIDFLVVGIDWAEAVLVDGFAGNGVSRLGRAFRLLRMLRLVRILRLMRMPQMTDLINEHIRSESIMLTAAILKIIFMMLGCNHIIACCWFGIGLISSSDDQKWTAASEVEMMDLGERYLVCFHWSLSQFAGELTIDPMNTNELLFTVCVLFSAIMGSASFVSSLTTAMTQLHMVTSHQSSQLSTLRRYLSDQKISRPLATRIQQNAQYVQREQKNNLPEDSIELLKYISTPLMIEVHYEIRSDIILEHPFFECYNLVNPGGVRTVCHTAVQFMDMHAGDVLFNLLEVPTARRMFFIVSGKMLYIREGQAPQDAMRGQWMCEAVLWTQWTHCGTTRASSTTRLLALDAEKLQKAIGAYPTDHVKQYVISFVEALNSREQEDLTDLCTLEKQLGPVIDRVFADESEQEDSDQDESEQASSRNSSQGTEVQAVVQGWGNPFQRLSVHVYGSNDSSEPPDMLAQGTASNTPSMLNVPQQSSACGSHRPSRLASVFSAMAPGSGGAMPSVLTGASNRVSATPARSSTVAKGFAHTRHSVRLAANRRNSQEVSYFDRLRLRFMSLRLRMRSSFTCLPERVSQSTPP